MKNDYIGVIDSGIGGLTVLKRLVDNFPNENFVYFGDNENLPYGNKTDRELSGLLFNAVFSLSINFKIRFIVVGCNTLSMTVLNKVKPYFDFPIYGVYPPLFLDDKKTILLSTERTGREYEKYNLNLAINKLPNLASKIEQNIFNLSNIDLEILLPYKKRSFDRVILGCTHYDFIKNEILDHLKPQEIFSSQDFAVNTIKKIYQNKKSIVKTYRNSVLFFGKYAKFNQKVWNLVVKDVKLYDKKQ